MFGIGSTELLVILVVALVVLGPKSLPGIAKTLGKVMGEFRRVSTEFQRTMNAEVAQDEHDKLKKEAEEELFGNDNVAATTSKTKDKPVKEDAKQESKTDADVKSSSQDDSSTEHIATNIDAKEECSVEVESPLAQAVAKAEAEACEKEQNSNRG